ncbi:type II toxin-antitoxin system Phd/YefM family antitoxin [Rhodoferax antarcticus]|uniref:Antitoxin n=1 Tax=Rhodoferax antarcticus ANT.BR TaxID=1111071 RepID=A0A1Q8YE82_9BURK|nr:type II toxin-antitoxin system prevent-host-death family antitoxin [Rhodoferax antarcticus]APW46191.1 hypothetical protein RA876_07195 [Rhodoferax antarcticus]MCW2313534.1 prevent-host-death family protein [Rhodoferax antarcticus]OLP06384.1 prevent-host-death family protein [Rhodoferax antarcticus ANT.BR]
MRSVSVADAKAHLSELLSLVEAGQALTISRRGRPVARLVPEPKAVTREPFDFAALAAFVDAQPAAAGNSVAAMRAQDSY